MTIESLCRHGQISITYIWHLHLIDEKPSRLWCLAPLREHIIIYTRGSVSTWLHMSSIYSFMYIHFIHHTTSQCRGSLSMVRLTTLANWNNNGMKITTTLCPRKLKETKQTEIAMWLMAAIEYLKIMFNHRHHHWAAIVSRGWAKASACRLQVCLSCAVLCQIVSLQYLSRSSLHHFAGLPCRIFLSYGLQVETRKFHRSSL